MNILIKNAALAVGMISATALIPAGASAQVAGVATADQTTAIIKSKALSAAYNQIGSTFASNGTLIGTKGKELNELRKSLDTNKDNQLDQAEMDAAVKAKNPVLAQMDAKELELNQLQEPIVKAQVYAVEQIFTKYIETQPKVAAAKKINMILAPDAFLWAPDAIDITAAMTAELDISAPTVSTTPPADWRPSRQGVALHQQIEQILNSARAQQAAQAQKVQQPVVPAAQQPQSR